MRIEIAQSIREILDERKTITIQGLGSIKLIQKPAYFGELRKTMFPPSVEMLFEESTSSNEALIQRLMENEGLTKKKAKEALNKYFEAVVNALVNYRKVRLKGICRLDQSKSGKIKLEADPAFIGAYFKDLPEVPAKIITTLPKDANAASERAPEEIISASSAVSLPEISDQSYKSEISQETHSTEEKVKSVMTDLIAEMKQEAPSAPSAKAEANLEAAWAPEKYDEGYGLIPWIIGAVLLAALVLFTIFSIRQCQPSQDMPFSNETPTEHVTDMLIADETQEEDSSSNEPLLLPEQCIIITGSFASQANVGLMMTKISDAGYDVYTERSGNYTRVGLSFDCADVDLPAYLQNIRATIAPQAWYLDPELYVEYE
ncbi:MAG: hypothetical protein HKN09_07880 [Saprospiraceae bacterium]|nr:hypothetical protein [Saprospiraceae bacterium]